MKPVEVQQGTSPIILGFAHTGTFLPRDIKANLNERGLQCTDTDWHIEKLYADLLPDCTTVRSTTHRYAIDVNRDPSGASLYPGQNTTGLVPLTDFDGLPIWNTEPDDLEIERRRLTYHQPYHDALAAEMSRVKKRHGVAILYDCHSIRSNIPFLFDGQLPDFNIGTNNGSTCAPEIESAVYEICSTATGYTTILNGRFKGGWTTRHYGKPDQNQHAIQMEIAQSTYLTIEKAPWICDELKANNLRIHLRHILKTLSDIAIQMGNQS